MTPAASYRALASAVVCQAIADVHKGARPEKGDGATTAETRRESALAWFYTASGRYWCDAAGRDAATVARRLVAGEYEARVVERGKADYPGRAK